MFECLNVKMLKRKGFTLIELLVVMAIIVIISGLSLVNWRGGEKQYALLRAANKLSQDLRRAEEMAMSSREFQGQIPKGGYGVYFKEQEKDHYILFADLNGNYSYDPGSDGLIEDVKIEKDIQISQLSSSPLTITFTPPDPIVTIKPDAPTATITLAIKTDPTKTRTIRVNKLGLVYIETQLAGVCITCYPDADADTYYSTTGLTVCPGTSCPSGYSGTQGTDCDDSCDTCYPGSTIFLTFADNKDQDCNGLIDEGSGYHLAKSCTLATMTARATVAAACATYCTSIGKNYDHYACSTYDVGCQANTIMSFSNCTGSNQQGTALTCFKDQPLNCYCNPQYYQ